MSYYTQNAGLGSAIEVNGNLRLGLVRDAPCAPPPAPPPPEAPAAVSGLGRMPWGDRRPLRRPLKGLGEGIAFPTIGLPAAAIDQVISGIRAPLSAAVDAAVTQAMAKLPETPEYKSARNGLLLLLGLQMVVVLGGMYFIEKDFGRK